jgi:hypothetical protein
MEWQPFRTTILPVLLLVISARLFPCKNEAHWPLNGEIDMIVGGGHIFIW